MVAAITLLVILLLQKLGEIGIQIGVQQICCDAMVRWFLQNRRVSQNDPNPSVGFLRSGPTLSYDIFVFRFYEAAVRDLRQSATTCRWVCRKLLPLQTGS